MCNTLSETQSHREIKRETWRLGGKGDKKRKEFYNDSTAMLQNQCRFYRLLQAIERFYRDFTEILQRFTEILQRFYRDFTEILLHFV
jgi:hypothetical protein